MNVIEHASDCAIHNLPAYPAEPCNCGAELRALGQRQNDEPGDPNDPSRPRLASEPPLGG